VLAEALLQRIDAHVHKVLLPVSGPLGHLLLELL
jgi:hypothetical protein